MFEESEESSESDTEDPESHLWNGRQRGVYFPNLPLVWLCSLSFIQAAGLDLIWFLD